MFIHETVKKSPKKKPMLVKELIQPALTAVKRAVNKEEKRMDRATNQEPENAPARKAKAFLNP